MKRCCFIKREYVVEFPNDGGASMERLRRDLGMFSLSMMDKTLYVSDATRMVHLRMAFDHLPITADHRFIVMDRDWKAVETWLSKHPSPGRVEWFELECVQPRSHSIKGHWAR